MLSFDITDRNIRIIRGAENKNKINISSAATLNIDEDIIVNGHVKDVPRLATIMNQKIKQNRMMDKEAIVSISSNMTIFKELTVHSAQKESEFTKAVKSEMQAKVGIDDSYAISYSIVGTGEDSGMVTVLATACPTEVIDSYKRVFSMLGISLRSVIIGCNCITKVLLSDEKNRSKMPLLAVQIDGSFISLNIYENNQLSFSRFASIDAADYDNSSDYVYEAVNENIFRMLQFHRSRNAGDPIRNVVLYGDTKEYMRIAKDLEQMDINTTVISVPKNVKGYQNLDFALYANAIGAMFPRNRQTEKINLLEFGGSTAMVMDKVKSDSTFNLIFAGAFLGTIVLMGVITGALAIRDAAIKSDIKKMNDYLNAPSTIEALAKRDQRLELQKQVKEYKRTATLASDALSSQPFISSEVYTTIEKTIEETISQAKVAGLSFNPKDNGKDKFKIEVLDYNEGQIKLGFTTLADKADPAMTFATLLAENLEKKDYFENISFSGYDMIEGQENIPQIAGQPDPSALNKDQKGQKVEMTIDLKSPVKYENFGSYVPDSKAEETEDKK
ncbi:pilus assembly protein PilM [Ruminococcus sp. HUN007]|uniref:type IV pilus biogenesis protein PilM n=1 Tax=Ruminococcus sp. HUN007 TaxID=1514668 RepID=UPI000678B7E5|nr:pilus assembly protein PilM [Ruminococcus sp. HUN007]